MKLAVFLSRFPYPLEKGDKLRAYHQIKELSKRHQIFLFCLTDSDIRDEWRRQVEPLCAELHVFRLKKWLIVWNTLRQVFSDTPYQVGYFYQRWIARRIDQHLQRVKPDHIYCQLLRTTEYVKQQYGIHKTLDYMDALGLGMQRRATISGGIRRWLFASEGRRLTAYENRIFDYFDHHVIISEQDRQFINHPKNREIVIVENGTDDSFFQFTDQVDIKYDLVFVGNLSYPPNIECAEFIVLQILPELQKLKPDVSIVLAGADPAKRVKVLEKFTAVKVSGWVEDIRISYRSARVFCAPLFIGSGMQNKLLQAMALGIPCVTTPLANNALNAVKGEHLLIAADRDQFVENILRLLSEPDLADKLVQNASKFVRAGFQWSTAVDKLENVLKSN